MSYEIEGVILTLKPTGRTTAAERRPVFDAIRADTRVPNEALLLIDGREVTAGVSEHVVIERVRILFDQLGPKLGHQCALIIHSELADEARIFQTAAADHGLRVGLFSDEQSARSSLKMR